jgi:hypothetical protein
MAETANICELLQWVVDSNEPIGRFRARVYGLYSANRYWDV